MTSPQIVRGSCLCGAVAFELEGDLTPIQLCHAERCRKATGAAMAPEMLAPAAGLRFVRGEDQITRYEAPLLDTPPAYRRAFCRNCGSPMPQPIEGTPFAGVSPGVLDDDPGTRPFRHAFCAQSAPWATPTDELPRFDGRPPRPRNMGPGPGEASG